MFLSKYGVARHIFVAISKAGSASHAVSADWTPAAGDVKISKDGGAAANVTNLPTAIAMGNSALWDFSLTATEMQAAQIVVTVADSATKAVDDTGFEVETYGNASAQHAADLADSVRLGLTALPNAVAGANGGLPLGNASGRVDVGNWLGSAPDALSSGKIPADLKLWLATAPLALSSQQVQVIVAAYASGQAPLQPTTAGRTLDVAATGEAGLDFDNIHDASGAHTLTNITVPVATAVTNDVGITQAAADKAWGTAARSLTDKAGFALTAAYDPAKTASQAGDAMALTSGERTTLTAAIWNALTSGLTTAGGIGKRLVDFVTTLVYSAPPTAAANAGAVWDEALSGHLASGSTGNALNAAGSAGDPWSTALPGSYGSGTAGNILGNRLDAAISSRSTYAGGDTSGTTTLLGRLTSTRAGLLDNLDAAISTRSTLGGTAQTGDAFARLGAPAGASVSADVAAIQAKTTNLPASPAAVGSAMMLTSGERNSTADALLARAIPASPTAGTVARALQLARADAHGKYSIVGDILTLYDVDNTTAVAVFTLAPSGGPYTSRMAVAE